jgi:hypothetical protein
VGVVEAFVEEEEDDFDVASIVGVTDTPGVVEVVEVAVAVTVAVAVVVASAVGVRVALMEATAWVSDSLDAAGGSSEPGTSVISGCPRVSVLFFK